MPDSQAAGTTSVRTNESGEPHAQGKIVPQQIAHLVIRSNNVKTLVAWYRVVFQADSVFDNGRLAFLYFDNEHHRIAIGEVPDLLPPNPKVAGFDHVAFAFKSIDDLLSTYVRLKALGIEPYYKIDHGPTTSFYYKDPDGNQLEFHVDNFETRERAHEYFRSEAFAKNPLGVEIDADQLVERWKAGEPSGNLLSSGTRAQRIR